MLDSFAQNAYARPLVHTMSKHIGGDDDESESLAERATERIAPNGMIPVSMHCYGKT